MQVLMTVRKELYCREPARMRLAVFAQCCLIADAVLSEEAAQVPPPGCIMRHVMHARMIASSHHHSISRIAASAYARDDRPALTACA